MKIAKNRGEWSELYALLKLLSIGKLYAADENLNRNESTYLRILKIIRDEPDGNKTEYVIASEDGSIEVHLGAEFVRNITRKCMEEMSDQLLFSIKQGGKGAFLIEDAERIMDVLKCTRVSMPASDKTDISMQLRDIHSGGENIYGFSIKSELGQPPTLLNASGATNFAFEVSGLNDEQMESVNKIKTRNKIKERIKKIQEYGEMKYYKPTNSYFAGNMMLIDTYMDSIISEMLLEFYAREAEDGKKKERNYCKALVQRLEERDPLGYKRNGIYEYKIKKFLYSVALGMIPSKEWNGYDDANGGYVIVKTDGDVVAYYVYNRNAFENYLLNNTKLDKGSTSRCGYALLYKNETGKMLINLNLQIRFI